MRFFSFLLLSAAATVSVSVSVSAIDNGVGIKPAMGWNSWNHFQCNIDETTIRGTADILVSSGLRDAGYIYLNVDDCWQASARTATGEIIADPVKFPSGFAALAEYVHSKGLKFGLYSDAGSNTCGGRPGSRGHEKQDALTYAKWGVDYLKYDNCNAPASDWIIDRYTAMSDALNATGRPILFSLCEWGVKDPWTWAPKIGNSWRTAMDIGDNWDSMIRCLTDSVGLAQYAGPGAWNDPDMLEVGNGGMNFNEYQTHFAIWSILKSPLLIGADIRSMSNETKSILMSTEVIALNQDPLGIAGDLVYQLGPHQVYAAPLADGSRGVVLVNLHTVFTQYPAHNITVQFSWIGYTDTTIAIVRDLYKQKDLGLHQGSFMGEVQPHGCLALRITPVLEEERDTIWRPWHATEAYYGKDKEELSSQSMMI